MIDPYKEYSESEILEHLDSDRSYHFLNCLKYHSRMHEHGIASIQPEEFINMALQLYSSAGSSRLLNVINDFLDNKEEIADFL